MEGKRRWRRRSGGEVVEDGVAGGGGIKGLGRVVVFVVLGVEEEVAESQRDRPFLRGLLGWSSDCLLYTSPSPRD